MIRKDTKDAVGSVGLGGGPDDEGAVMIGYATYPDVEGRGFATEAADALIRWVLPQPGVAQVCATLPPDNRAAIRVAEKLGMSLVGTVWEEDLDEVLLYSVKGDYAAKAARYDATCRWRASARSGEPTTRAPAWHPKRTASPP